MRPSEDAGDRPDRSRLILGWSPFGVLSRAALAGSARILPDRLFPQSDKRDWPQGVQEIDVPRFAVEHLDALGPLDAG